jgi:hypothetical protein
LVIYLNHKLVLKTRRTLRICHSKNIIMDNHKYFGNLSELDWSASCISFDWLSFCSLASTFKLLPRKDRETSKRLATPFTSTSWKPAYSLVGRYSLMPLICNCNHTKTLINSPVPCNQISAIYLVVCIYECMYVHKYVQLCYVCMYSYGMYVCLYIRMYVCMHACIHAYIHTYRSFATDNSVANSKLAIFQEKHLNDLKCYTFLQVQRRRNCSPAASFANCVDTIPVKSSSANVSFYTNN